MHGRVEARLVRAGLEGGDLGRVLALHAAALRHRLAVLTEQEHPDLLHPSRTLLILLDDCDVVDPDVLEAAVAVESEFPALRIHSDLPLARAVPLPAPAHADPELLESLVVAPREVRLIAIAERLDHARHLHLGPPERWPEFHELFRDAYAPVAHRTHPQLARRCDRWAGAFGRRFLTPDSRS